MRGVRVERISVACHQCGTSFNTILSRIEAGTGKFCSTACARAALDKRTSVKCQTCGKPFLASPSVAAHARFCSKMCVRLIREPVGVRFWKYVNAGGKKECWEWQGALSSHGYGQLSNSRQSPLAAHRVSYELHFGAIPAGSLVRHSCDNPKCVNPAHLSLGDKRSNARDMMDRGRSRRGRKHFACKLSVRDVSTARRMHADGQTISSLARRYGVSSATMADAIYRRTWTWLK